MFPDEVACLPNRDDLTSYARLKGFSLKTRTMKHHESVAIVLERRRG